MKKVDPFISILSIVLLAISMNTMADGKGNGAYFVKVDNETTTQKSMQDDPDKKQITRQEKKIPGTHKAGDVTLKHGMTEGHK